MTDSDILRLLSEAAHWRLISALLACPQGDWQSQIAELAAEVNDEPLTTAADAMINEASEGLYHTTFGPGGPAAPREVSYREYVVPGQSLAELSLLYRLFGYRPATDEPLDHVCVEADFIAYLRFKEAYALSRGNAEQAAISGDAASRFLTDHLASIAQPLAQSLKASGIAYLALASEALLNRVGPTHHTPGLVDSVLPTWDDDSTACCGATAPEVEGRGSRGRM